MPDESRKVNLIGPNSVPTNRKKMNSRLESHPSQNQNRINNQGVVNRNSKGFSNHRMNKIQDTIVE